MTKKFFKYQSLGNDFILFDWYLKNDSFIEKNISKKDWPQFVINICKRLFAIGADGILILKKNQKLNLPEMLIYNSDGTQAEICLNGLRCTALHLYTNHKFAKIFKLKIGSQIIECKIIKKNKKINILNKIESAKYIGKKIIQINNKKIIGHIVNVGNPHFIVFEKTNLEWLKKYGSKIETNKIFPNKTNVEFVWQDKNNNFNAIVYERGCGITLACSSGATAIIWALFQLKKLKIKEKITLNMPGGQIESFINNNYAIVLQATANFVFEGKISTKEINLISY